MLGHTLHFLPLHRTHPPFFKPETLNPEPETLTQLKKKTALPHEAPQCDLRIGINKAKALSKSKAALDVREQGWSGSVGGTMQV